MSQVETENQLMTYQGKYNHGKLTKAVKRGTFRQQQRESEKKSKWLTGSFYSGTLPCTTSEEILIKEKGWKFDTKLN